MLSKISCERLKQLGINPTVEYTKSASRMVEYIQIGIDRDDARTEEERIACLKGKQKQWLYKKVRTEKITGKVIAIVPMTSEELNVNRYRDENGKLNEFFAVVEYFSPRNKRLTIRKPLPLVSAVRS